MTNEEALNRAKRECEAYRVKVENGKDWLKGMLEFWILIVDALEKQIPKKPKLHQEYDEYPTAYCSCGAYLGYAELAQESEMYFCPNCGQALLWEVGAEEDDN